MTALTTRGYPYRVGSDPADIAAATQALAAAVDSDLTASNTPMKVCSLGDFGPMALTGTSLITPYNANRAYQVCFVPKTTFTATKFLWWCTTQSGNYDVGVLNALTNVRLWSKGATACPAPGTITVTITPSLTLQAGTRYLMAIATDNSTIAFRGMTLGSSDMAYGFDGTVLSGDTGTSYPIPSTIGARSVDTRVPLLELRA
jgi:hypothetical protein